MREVELSLFERLEPIESSSQLHASKRGGRRRRPSGLTPLRPHGHAPLLRLQHGRLLQALAPGRNKDRSSQTFTYRSRSPNNHLGRRPGLARGRPPNPRCQQRSPRVFIQNTLKNSSGFNLFVRTSFKTHPNNNVQRTQS